MFCLRLLMINKYEQYYCEIKCDTLNSSKNTVKPTW